VDGSCLYICPLGHRVDAVSAPRILVGNEELFTVRDAMRGLNRIVDDIVEGKLDKVVLTRHGKMLCAVVPLGNIESLYLTDQPGGKRAIAHGCSCPEAQPDALKNRFVVDKDCALHGLAIAKAM
jgi:hypothetical protein